MKLTALAACAALLIGLGPRLLPGSTVEPPPVDPVVTATPTPTPTYSLDGEDSDAMAFTAAGPGEEAKYMFPMLLWVGYNEVTEDPQVAASLALPDGAFTVELTKEDIQKLFWGPEGKPEVENVKTDPGDFPLMLMNWAGYTISGGATYDGNGDLWELYVHGEKGEDSFALRAAPGRIPPTCLVEPRAAVTQVRGVEVTGWYRSYDRDGDGVVEHVCTSQFLANGVGFRFENVGSGGLRAGEDEATDLGGAMAFNEMVVTQLTYEGGFYLDQFAHNDDIPAWAEEGFDTLAEAKGYGEYARFAPYLPTQGPAGFGEFYGRHSYQADNYDSFWLRWTKGYDDVEVEVRYPEGESTHYAHTQLVDVTVPASYDWRLYDGAICDVVPEAYQDSFYKPAFRAQDMSLEVVKARMRDKDTGGQSCNFYVIHENGVVVGYSCSGVSAEYVWGLVEATLGE